ncbi:hypothetical protein GUJ93_ZPchr0009g301 [Zizania palustris]|uniref:Nuclear pore complex protein NUP1 n=1 Tax=Zizania palustris TaxID=103762 RepID=A0A8J5RM78_ZIZPA|nr:hypothetical protein GUJ93_ZPchr0009g301 [Zizania palustris]
MASRGGYDVGTGAGGKIRRRPPPRAGAASPYARPAPAPAAVAAARGGDVGRGWFSRLIASGASRLLSSVFRKPSSQLPAPPQPQPQPQPQPEAEPLDAPLSRPESPDEVPLQADTLDTPPSPPPPPLEDDIAEGEEDIGAIANNSANDGDDILRRPDSHDAMDVGELLKQRTFTRSEFEYLSELLRSRTAASVSLKPEAGNIEKMHFEKDNGPRDLPVNFITRPYDNSSVVASRDLSGAVSSSYQAPSSVHTFGRQVLKRKSTALNSETVSVGPIRKMRQRYNRVSPLLETRMGYRGYLGSHASKLGESLEHSPQTQKRRCLDKIGDVTRVDVDDRAHGNSFGQAPAQSSQMAAKILKQLDTLVPPQKEDTLEIRQKHADGLDVEDPISQKSEVFAQGSLLKPSLSGVKESLLNNTNVAAKFTSCALDGKTVDATLHRSAVTTPTDFLEMENYRGSTELSLHQSNDKKEKKQSLMPDHTATNPGITNKEKPPTFSLRSHAPSNLVLSSEIDRNKMLASSNGFSFPVPAALSVHSQAPPTPTLASPPVLSVEKQQQLSASTSAPVTSVENFPRIFKPASDEGSISSQCHTKPNADNPPVSSLISTKPNADNPPVSSLISGRIVSFTSNPVFNVVSSKSTSLSNGLGDTTKSTASAVFSSNGSTKSNAGSSTTSFPQFSFQSGFQTSTSSAQQSSGTQVKAEPAVTVSFSTVSSLYGGSFTFSNIGTGSSLPSSTILAGMTSQCSSNTISGSAPSQFSPQFGSESSLAGQEKLKAASHAAPFNLSPQFGTASSFAVQVKSKAVAPQSTLFSGNQFAQSGNSNSLFTQTSASISNLLSSEKVNPLSSPSLANSPFGFAASGSCPAHSTSLFSFAAGSGSTSATATATAASSSLDAGFGVNAAFSASPTFGSPNTASATSPFSSISSPVFSFTSATPTIPNASPTKPLFGTASPTGGLSTGTDQMNGGHMIGDKNQLALPTASPFVLSSSSPSTLFYNSPASQFASTTSASPGIFQFGQQSQASPGGFSMGTGGTTEKSGRRILKVKRKK